RMIVYKITNKINQKIYIGITKRSLEQRWNAHIKDSKTSQYAIHRAIRKYGLKNFIIEKINAANSLEEALNKESGLIESLDSMNPKIGYNMLAQDNIKRFSEGVKIKISRSQKQRFKNLSSQEKNNIYTKSAKTHQGKSYVDNKYVGVTKNKCSSWSMN